MKLLVSVRSVEEALLAADGGADFIDLKEPGHGALGGLPIATIREIVGALRHHGSGLDISATIGDVAMDEADRIAACVDAVGACGVDYVKVGIERAPQARAVLDALAASGWPIVPVFIADKGLDLADVAHACALGFAGVMADTSDKRAGSLFDAVPMAELRRFIATAREAGVMVGLAGALRAAHEPLLRALAPGFAGFRTAVCEGDRSAALDPQRLRTLVAVMLGHATAEPGATHH
ncbi:(5-formylfuran-3-yl)methyl phosphate synthase [Variovorax sp. J2P1-59]|uniref:(5-formylfuran-3-yl)methyl phosphate synthase n=1 Tax=Variovorax flavidus TaxID=3053501 RepID=UPI0025777EC7|nr:(5-formylfuran-3-yl)methyl phosphate synthase [Variovorax sp. J2P1-59]MDM0073258.1 (5-formylfuran-3-yl)methyl phosphate synthase [Variovorax sp. J2P1-59]